MTLTMRARVMGKKVTLISTAFVLAVSTLTAAVPFIFAQGANAVGGDSTVTVSGDTAPGYDQPGWMFNRDTTTSTPFSFHAGNAKIGTGSLAVAPIGNTNYKDKFIAEYFVQKPVSDITSISVDYKLGAGSRADFAYATVYANFASSPATKYYDCRYDVLTTGGSSSTYTTLTFSPTSSYTVTTHATSPTLCPASPAAMGAGATIRAYAFSYGNTNPTGDDAGNGAFFDKAVVATTTGTTTYDFEPATVAAPTNLRFVKGATSSTTAVAANATVNYDGVTLKWDAVAGDIERYVIRQTSPSGAVEDRRNQSTTYYAINDDSRYGYFGNEQGTYTYQVSAKSATTGAWSAYSAPITLNFDTQAPTASVTANGNALPDAGKILAGANTTFVVTLSDPSGTPEGAYIELFKANYLGGYTDGWVSDNTPSRNPGNVRNGSTPTLVYNLSALSGKYGLKITYKDSLGNAGSKYVYFTVDNTLPGVAFVTAPTQNAFVKGTVTIAAQATDANPGDYTLTATGPATVSLNTATPFVTGTTYTSSWNTELTDDGVYAITAKATDQAGQENTATRTVTVDNTVPTLSVDNPANLVVGGNFAVTGSVSDTNLDYYKYQILDSNKNTISGFNSTNGGTANTTGTLFTADVKDLSEGTYYVSVWAQDKAGNATNISGNRKEAPYIVKFVLDKKAPTVVSTQYSPSTTTNGPVVVTISFDEATTVTTAGWAATDATNTVFTKSFTADTDETVAFKDAVGNTSSTNVSVNWIDREAPTATVEYSTETLTNGDVTVTITASEPVTVTTPGWAASNGNTVFTKTFVANVEETVSFSDEAGNEGSVDVVIDWIDTTSPVIGSATANGATVRSESVTFSVDDDSAVEVIVNGQTVVAAGNGTYTVTGDGTYTVLARDAAGNVSLPFSFTIGHEITSSITVDNPNSATPTVSGVATYIVSPASAANVALVVTIDATTYNVTTDASGAWSVVFANNATGLHAVSVRNADNDVVATYGFEALIDPGTNGANVPSIVGAAANSDVLGESDQASDPSADVDGAATDNVAAADTDSTDGTVLGVAWYWWLLIIAALATILWWIVRAVRRRSTEA